MAKAGTCNNCKVKIKITTGGFTDKTGKCPVCEKPMTIKVI